MDTYHLLKSPLGPLLLALEDGKITGLWFEGQKTAPEHTDLSGGAPAPVRAAEEWFSRYFAGEAPDPAHLPVHPRGTDFQRAVWALMSRIPYGRTATYGALSAALRRRGVNASPRAVGSAVGRNPVSILLPCHRVVGADGSLTGYAGGTERKAYLLALEGAAPPPMDGAAFEAHLCETEITDGSERP